VIPLECEVSVGRYQRLAHEAIDEIVADGGPAIVAGGTGLYFRAALSELGLPPAPAAGARERWSAAYDELGPEAAHTLLVERDPAAGARVHANDRRRVIRALELAEAGETLAPAVDRLRGDTMRHPTLLLGLDLPNEKLDARIDARVAAMVGAGAAAEAKAAWNRPLSATARKVLGLEQFATRPPAEAAEAVALATRRLARYQRKWLRRLNPAATLDGDRPPEEIADEIVALGGAGKRVSRG
jgi:tRNA dimethylallyltransferase